MKSAPSWILLAGLIILSSFLLLNSARASDTANAFCEHQGYTLKTEGNDSYCYFNSTSKCNAVNFYNGTCGIEFIKKFSCVDEGKKVFVSFEECCNGLSAYPFNNTENATCVKISPVGKLTLSIGPFLEKIFNAIKAFILKIF